MSEIKPAQPSDEIDITQLFRWIGRGFKNFGLGIIMAIAGLRNLFFTNRAFFSVIILAGLVVGGSYYQFLSRKFYKSSMIISCDYLNNRIMENAIEKLNLLCLEQDRDGLAGELKIDIDVAKNIRKFYFKPFVSEKDLVEIEVLKEQLNNVAAEKKDLVDKVISKVDVENKHAFQIEVLIYNPDIVKNLEIAIVDYFASNAYIKGRIEINKQNLQARKSKLTKESNKLDSLKQILYQNLQSMARQNREGSNNVILSDKYLTDPMEIYTEDLDLNNELLEIDKKLYLQPDFELVDGFTTFKEPESASLLKILGISFLISLVLGYVIIGLWRFDQYLASFAKKPN
ncbi:MAG TPA: hypothetical protein VFW11_21595 [Cyclobacteriaceae bacterium]|nr:hypothetical protein [Cyclobacteriaceae bacterium]